MFDRVLNRPVITNKFFSFQCVWCQELFKFLPVSPTQAAFTCSKPTMEKCVKLPKKCVKLPKVAKSAETVSFHKMFTPGS